MIDVVLMGCGRWGRRLLAALQSHPRIRVAAVVDPDPAARAHAKTTGVPVFASFAEAPAATATLIATPTPLHAEHALQALDAGSDVFVEKPLALTAADADRLCASAADSGRVAMVGHVLRFHPRVVDFVEQVNSGKLGFLHDLYARRFTRSGSPDPLWTLGPHDLSTLRAIDHSEVVEIERTRSNGSIALSVHLQSGLSAHLEMSTTAEQNERTTVIYGSNGSASLDELKEGDVGTPLTRELDHFVDCVAHRRKPRASFDDARWVVSTLERASRA